MSKIISYIAIIVSVLSLMVAGLAVGLNREPGPEGKQGLIGPQGTQGIKGDTGSQGPTGANAPVNNLPTINLLNTNGNYIGIIPRILNYCKYVYGITVSVKDLDKDTLKISFYYSDSTTGPWNDVSVFYGTNGSYYTSQEFTYTIPQGSKRIYWLVEAWDGSDITTSIYPYTITP